MLHNFIILTPTFLVYKVLSEDGADTSKLVKRLNVSKISKPFSALAVLIMPLDRGIIL